MKRVDRGNLLQRLLAVEPGASRRDIQSQESCVVLRRSWLYTYNLEIACAIGTALESNITGAVQLAPLIAYLKTLNEAGIEVGSDSADWLVIQSKGARWRLPVLTDVRLPVDRVDRPQAWAALSPKFSEAVALVQRCTRKYKSRKDNFAQACVHIAPNWLEASDNTKMARFELATFVSEPCLVRATSLKEMIPLGFTEASVTKLWVHFRNPLGLRMSIRKWEPESYPDLGQFLSMRGRRITLPQGLKMAARRGELIGELGREGKMIDVRISKDGMELNAANAGTGSHAETKGIGVFNGAPLNFRISAELLGSLAEQKGVIEVSDASLRLSDGPYTYLTSLSQLESKNGRNINQAEQA
jgi:hypothetical protein